MKTKIIALLFIISFLFISCEDPVKYIQVEVTQTQLTLTSPKSSLDSVKVTYTFIIEVVSLEQARQMYPNLKEEQRANASYIKIDDKLCYVWCEYSYQFKILNQ